MRCIRIKTRAFIRLVTQLIIAISHIAMHILRCQWIKYAWGQQEALRQKEGRWVRMQGKGAANTPLVLDRRRLQKWRSLLALGALLIAGCLLLLHLHVVDSLSTYVSLHDVQGGLPHLPVLPESWRVVDTARVQQLRGFNNFKEEGVPEAEMIAPVKNDPLLDAVLQASLDVQSTSPRPNASWCHYQNLEVALTEKSENKEIFIQVIPDSDHVLLAKNNLVTLVRRTGKNNLLFVCRDVLQCEATLRHDVMCYIDVSLPGSSAPIFSIILTALRLKYTVIYFDFDTSIIGVPSTAMKSGMFTPYGLSSRAHSLYMVAYSVSNIRFHKMAIQDAEVHSNKSFPAVFKSVLDRSLKMKPPVQINGAASCLKIPSAGGSCPFLRHPNFALPADRMLWLKEKQMWFTDTDGYYSSLDTLYLSYENNYDMGRRTVEYEVHALKNALAFGEILQRKIVLPKFLCPKCHNDICKPVNCLLSAIINMTKFDCVFGKTYREHSFRGHPLVPLTTKKNISENIQIASPLRRGMQAIGGVEILPKVTPNKVILADNFYEGPDSDEVLELFLRYRDKKILRFVNLYGAFSGFNSAYASLEFERRLKEGIVLLDRWTKAT